MPGSIRSSEPILPTEASPAGEPWERSTAKCRKVAPTSYLTASGLLLLGGIFLAGPAYAEDALAVFRGGRLGALFMRGGTTSLIFANQSAAIISA